ncbi:class I SAM-dependent methyltransferase [Thalassolituus sp. LLYu03]|uniref:class I SAM-dependent methyltransferase n=1 Tax=Thalassolituus sp. LLYu03 TaxID=3421656 RepID=UPI003D2B14E7
MPAGNHLPQSLQQALLLPGAQLQAVTLSESDLRLWLMQLENPEVELGFRDIERLWQALPYWAFAWAGGQALAAWIRRNPQAVAGKRVLDFGCGSGIAGIAAGLAGAREVWMADLDSNALTAACENARLNGIDVQCVEGDWPEVDVLLAADVLYDISSSADLRTLMMQIPQWLLAETRFVAPDFVDLECLGTDTWATLPRIGDFDEAVEVEIYCRAGQSPLV